MTPTVLVIAIVATALLTSAVTTLAFLYHSEAQQATDKARFELIRCQLGYIEEVVEELYDRDVARAHAEREREK